MEKIPYYTVADVAKLEGVTSKTIYIWIRTGVISPVVQYGNANKVFAIAKDYKKSKKNNSL